MRETKDGQGWGVGGGQRIQMGVQGSKAASVLYFPSLHLAW